MKIIYSHKGESLMWKEVADPDQIFEYPDDWVISIEYRGREYALVPKDQLEKVINKLNEEE